MPRVYSLERLAGGFAVLCLAIAALLLGNPSFSNASLPVRGITDPVIALEFARSVVDVDYVLGDAPSSDREVMRVKVRIGFASIAAYTGLFVCLALLMQRAGGPGRMLAPAAIVCAGAAAAFNIAASIAVLSLLDVPLFETTGAMINAIRSASFASWALAAVTLGLLSPHFLRSPKLLPRSIGALFAITAIMQLYGLRDGQFLVLGSVPAGLALIGVVVTRLFEYGVSSV